MAKAKISDFRPQERNANRHTPRGLGMLDKSMADNGFIGAMTSAADGEIFDGSARLETAYDRFGEEIEPIVINADGTRPIIVVRTDIPSADHPKAKKLSIAANRIPAVDLDWDPEVLMDMIIEDVDISDLFFDGELEEIAESNKEVEAEPAELNLTRKSLNKKAGFVKVVLSNVEVSVFEKALAATGIGSRSDALIKICEDFLNGSTDQEGQFDILQETFS